MQEGGSSKFLGVNLFVPNFFVCHVQNLEAWEEAKKEIEKIPDHPNKAPAPPDTASSPSGGDPVPSSSNRRDSTATVNGR